MATSNNNPFDEKRRKALNTRINKMNPTELRNMEILLNSKNANAMIAKENGLSGIKMFL